MQKKTEKEIKDEYLRGLNGWFEGELDSFNELLTTFLSQGLEMDYGKLKTSLDILEMAWKQIFKKHKQFILENRDRYHKDLHENQS